MLKSRFSRTLRGLFYLGFSSFQQVLSLCFPAVESIRQPGVPVTFAVCDQGESSWHRRDFVHPKGGEEEDRETAKQAAFEPAPAHPFRPQSNPSSHTTHGAAPLPDAKRKCTAGSAADTKAEAGIVVRVDPRTGLQRREQFQWRTRAASSKASSTAQDAHAPEAQPRRASTENDDGCKALG